MIIPYRHITYAVIEFSITKIISTQTSLGAKMRKEGSPQEGSLRPSWMGILGKPPAVAIYIICNSWRIPLNPRPEWSQRTQASLMAGSNSYLLNNSEQSEQQKPSHLSPAHTATACGVGNQQDPAGLTRFHTPAHTAARAILNFSTLT